MGIRSSLPENMWPECEANIIPPYEIAIKMPAASFPIPICFHVVVDKFIFVTFIESLMTKVSHITTGKTINQHRQKQRNFMFHHLLLLERNRCLLVLSLKHHDTSNTTGANIQKLSEDSLVLAF
jgi:hypothetical protein